MDTIQMSAFADELQKIAFLGAVGKVVGKGVSRLATQGAKSTAMVRGAQAPRKVSAVITRPAVGTASSGVRNVTRVGEVAAKPMAMATRPQVIHHAPPTMAQNMRLRATQAGNWIKKNPGTSAAIGAGALGVGATGYSMGNRQRRQ